MGQGMARRILRGGHNLAVHDTSHARDIVVTMLVEDAVVTDVALRPGGIRDSLPAGAIHLAMGTYGVAAIRTLAAAHTEANQFLVAAPVLGRPDLAASGQLGIVTAGPDDAVQRCAPLLEAIGRRSFHAGTLPEAAT